MMDWKKIGLFAGGILMGSYGVRILSSSDAKKAYTHTTAAVLRMKDTVMKDVTTSQLPQRTLMKRDSVNRTSR